MEPFKQKSTAGSAGRLVRVVFSVPLVLCLLWCWCSGLPGGFAMLWRLRRCVARAPCRPALRAARAIVGHGRAGQCGARAGGAGPRTDEDAAALQCFALCRAGEASPARRIAASTRWSAWPGLRPAEPRQELRGARAPRHAPRIGGSCAMPAETGCAYGHGICPCAICAASA